MNSFKPCMPVATCNYMDQVNNHALVAFLMPCRCRISAYGIARQHSASAAEKLKTATSRSDAPGRAVLAGSRAIVQIVATNKMLTRAGVV